MRFWQRLLNLVHISRGFYEKYKWTVHIINVSVVVLLIAVIVIQSDTIALRKIPRLYVVPLPDNHSNIVPKNCYHWKSGCCCCCQTVRDRPKTDENEDEDLMNLYNGIV